MNRHAAWKMLKILTKHKWSKTASTNKTTKANYSLFSCTVLTWVFYELDPWYIHCDTKLSVLKMILMVKATNKAKIINTFFNHLTCVILLKPPIIL